MNLQAPSLLPVIEVDDNLRELNKEASDCNSLYKNRGFNQTYALDLSKEPREKLIAAIKSLGEQEEILYGQKVEMLMLDKTLINGMNMKQIEDKLSEIAAEKLQTEFFLSDTSENLPTKNIIKQQKTSKKNDGISNFLSLTKTNCDWRYQQQPVNKDLILQFSKMSMNLIDEKCKEDTTTKKDVLRTISNKVRPMCNPQMFVLNHDDVFLENTIWKSIYTSNRQHMDLYDMFVEFYKLGVIPRVGNIVIFGGLHPLCSMIKKSYVGFRTGEGSSDIHTNIDVRNNIEACSEKYLKFCRDGSVFNTAEIYESQTHTIPLFILSYTVNHTMKVNSSIFSFETI